MVKKSNSLLPPDWKKTILPHILIALGALVVLLIYFKPATEGKVINQQDIRQYRGMSKKITDFREETGEEPLWTNSAFGGMPAYQIHVNYPGNLFKQIQNLFWKVFPAPVGIYFIMFLGFYLLMSVLGAGPYLSGVGAVAFTFSSYFFIAIEAGHNTKIHAMAYVAPIIAGILLAYRGKILLGAILTSIFTAFELAANHFQVTYYLFFIIICIGISEFVNAIRKKTLPKFAIASGALILAGVIGVGPNLANLWPTYEYSKATIRGKSELKEKQEAMPSGGLDKDYALDWSYGPAETFTLLIPNVYGGASGADVGEDSETYDILKNVAGAANAKKYVKRWPTYYGDQRFTSGPVYVGAIVCFLFVLGLILVEGRLKWWLLAATVLSIMLAWGRHFLPLTDFFFNYFPIYNKFRAVSMMLIIAEFTMPVLAILGLKKLMDKKKEPEDHEQLLKSLYIAAGVTGGLALLFAVAAPMVYDFFVFPGQMDKDLQTFARMFGQETTAPIVGQLADALKADRIAMIRKDAFRSLVLILLSGGLIWAFLKDKIKEVALIAGVGVLILGDLWMLDKRFLNEDNFEKKKKNRQTYTMGTADREILKDPAISYRVLSLQNPFAESRTAYFHQSIGGYHAAKIRRYQELYDYLTGQEVQGIIGMLNKGATQPMLSTVLSSAKTLNMMNTKYLIADPNRAPIRNPHHFGNAWFAEKLKWAENADEELALMRDADLKNTVVVAEEFRETAGNLNPAEDSTASIKMTLNEPNHLKYEFEASKNMVAVFSEIYYNDTKGWKAYIDGEHTPHFRVNFVLRALGVPAGKHTIEFKFEPKSYRIGNQVAWGTSILLIVCFAGWVVLSFVKKVKQEEAA